MSKASLYCRGISASDCIAQIDMLDFTIVAYLIRTSDFADLEEPCAGLLQVSSTNTVFHTLRWQAVWWQQFHHGAELLLLSVYRDTDLVGIAPLMRQGERISFIGDSNLCDYLDLIVARGQESAVAAALLEHLDSLQWKILDLPCLLPRSPVISHLAPLARERGNRAEVTQMDTCPQVELPPTWEEYLAGLRAKERHELRRKLRRLDQAGMADCYAIADKGRLDQGVEDFIRLFRASRKDKAQFMTPEMASFFRSLAHSMAEAGYLRLYFLELDGVRVATAMCFDYGDVLYLYNSGYDPRYAFLSVSLLLKALCLRDAIEGKKRCFDFLRGAEPYKYRLGGRDMPVYRCLVRRP